MNAPVDVLILPTPSLGDRTTVVHDGSTAFVVDPQRDLDRLERLLDDHGLALGAVAETHVHNDYVTGGYALARAHGVPYLVAADEDVAFERTAVRDGDTLTVGALEVRVLHTPGHTPHHLSYVVGRDGRDQVACTGGSLLYGSVGRTDLIGADVTEQLTRSQHRSARRLVAELEDDVAVLPTHGFGSFCSSGDTSGADASTIGRERRENQALLEPDEDAFVATLLAGLDAYPAYYARMGPANRRGPDAADLTPPEQVERHELAARIHAGEWVVDLRDRRAFADGHLLGSINVELGDSFVTYLGWLLPDDVPVTLVGRSADEVADAQRQLARIGVDPAGSAEASTVLTGDLASYPARSFAQLVEARATDPGVVLLDTRRDLEVTERPVDGAVHIPLHDLVERLDELPAGEVWVHCASGYRAAIAASLLQRAGRTVVLVDDEVSNAPEVRR